jgi:hypothetical protein
MATSRYAFTPLLPGRQGLGTSKYISRIYYSVKSGALPFSTTTLIARQRLDHIAHLAYGSSDLWWIISAASGIGWNLQAPPGTIIRIPKELSRVFALMR